VRRGGCGPPFFMGTGAELCGGGIDEGVVGMLAEAVFFLV